MTDVPFILALLVLGAVIVALYVFSIIWAFGDARARGRSGVLVAIVVALLSWPLGLILWIVLRPEPRSIRP